MESLLDDVSKCNLKLDIAHDTSISVSSISKQADGNSQIQVTNNVLMAMAVSLYVLQSWFYQNNINAQ